MITDDTLKKIIELEKAHFSSKCPMVTLDNGLTYYDYYGFVINNATGMAQELLALREENKALRELHRMHSIDEIPPEDTERLPEEPKRSITVYVVADEISEKGCYVDLLGWRIYHSHGVNVKGWYYLPGTEVKSCQ